MLLAAFQFGLFLAGELVLLKRRGDGGSIRVAPNDRGLGLALVNLGSWPEESLGLVDLDSFILAWKLWNPFQARLLLCPS